MALRLEIIEPPFGGMHTCDFGKRTYHWVRLMNTVCYTERQREEVKETDN